MSESLRNNWEYTYTAEQVLQGAVEKMKHHRARLKWWMRKRDEVRQEIGRNGIKVNDGLGANNSVQFSTTYQQPEVMIDNELTKQMSECNAKVREHTAKYTDYAGWTQVLMAQTRQTPMPTLKLKKDDWMFFFSTSLSLDDEEQAEAA